MINFNGKKWLESLNTKSYKKSMPILSFPSAQLLGCSVKELLLSSENQANGMKLIADKTPSLASVSFMDLSVEAECFGSEISITEDEIPTVTSTLITNIEEAENLRVPKVGEKRSQTCIKAVELASNLITDRPVFAGMIGSFSLAGRLLDVTEALMYCYDDPDILHTVLEKCTQFLIEYALAFKKVGANGVVIAEPLAGLLSPDFASEFSSNYIKQIVDAVQDDEFLVIYHNCGNTVIRIIDQILETGSSAYHFGNAVDMKTVMEKIPTNVIAMGNIDPVSQFKDGTSDTMKNAVCNLLNECSSYPNFVISSGCDIPPLAKWENISAYYQAIDEFYKK